MESWFSFLCLSSSSGNWVPPEQQVLLLKIEAKKDLSTS